MAEDMEYTCHACGTVDDRENMMEGPDGGLYCEECYGDTFFTCDDCGEVFAKENTSYYECIQCGDYVCEDCANVDEHGEAVCGSCLHRYEICSHCGHWSRDRDMENVRGRGMVCDECISDSGDYFHCDCCDTTYCMDDCGGECMGCGNLVCDGCSNFDGNDGNVCDDCSEYWRRCEQCECWVHENDQVDDCCPDCAESLRRGGTIHRYDYKPTPIFYGDGLAAYEMAPGLVPFMNHFGIELEVDKGRDFDVVGALADWEELYVKHDGSLSNGFEIVSHPCRYEYHKDNLGWDEVISKVHAAGFRSHDAGTCGLHIHISREAFGRGYETQDRHLAKLLYLVEKFWDQVLKFSRRTSQQANQWARRYCEGPGQVDAPDVILDRAKGAGRYYAVNLQNRTTVELRIFRGTLNKRTFQATLAFAKLLVEVSTSLTVEQVQGLTWNQFTAYGASDKNLTEYLGVRSLLDVALAEPAPVQANGNLWTTAANERPLPTASVIMAVLRRSATSNRWEYTEPVREDLREAMAQLYVAAANDDRDAREACFGAHAFHMARMIYRNLVVINTSMPTVTPSLAAGLPNLGPGFSRALFNSLLGDFRESDEPPIIEDIRDLLGEEYIREYGRQAALVALRERLAGICIYRPRNNVVSDSARLAMAFTCHHHNTSQIESAVAEWIAAGTYDEVMARWEATLVRDFGMVNNRVDTRNLTIVRVDGQFTDEALQALADWQNYNIHGGQGESTVSGLREVYAQHRHSWEAMNHLAQVWQYEFEAAGLRDNINEVFSRLAGR